MDPRPGRAPVAAEHVGAYLRRVRTERAIPLEDVAHKTKVKIEFLRLLEDNRLDALPAEVFVRGFARAYAGAVRADAAEVARLLGAPAAERAAAQAALVAEAAALPPPTVSEPDGRRRFGVVLVVLVILIAATLTLSLLLRRPGPTAGGLSQASDEARAQLRA